MPMIPETVVAMLACARLGRAAHRRVRRVLLHRAVRPDHRLRRARRDHRRRRLPPRRGVGAQAGGGRGAARSARTCAPSLVVKRTGQDDIEWNDDQDVWWHDVVDVGSRPSTSASSSTPSTRCSSCTRPASTGKPKGILHTSGGYLTQVAYTHHAVFDLKPDEDLYWCGADIGWITGHSYIVYGPLANRATSFMYEGVAEHPGRAPLVRDDREVQDHDPLHRADHDPHVHEVGRGHPGGARPVVAAAARLGR